MFFQGLRSQKSSVNRNVRTITSSAQGHCSGNNNNNNNKLISLDFFLIIIFFFF